jgi:predicted nucleic acid-binding protein
VTAVSDDPHKAASGRGYVARDRTYRGWHLLTDDRAARMVARRLGVTCSGTLALLIRAVRQGILTLDEGNDLLAEMIARARYRSPVSNLRDLLEQ